MSFRFALKDNGWWLKVQSIDELTEYYKITAPTRNGKVFENYFYGKEWNWAHPCHKNTEHCPHYAESGLTDAVVRYGSQNNLSIYQAIQGFSGMILSQQAESILKSGAIYINQVGGYHSAHPSDRVSAIIYRDDLVFPDYNKSQIKITKFPYGNHYYAHIGDLEVKDGSTIKWNTYEEAYKHALAILDRQEGN